MQSQGPISQIKDNLLLTEGRRESKKSHQPKQGAGHVPMVEAEEILHRRILVHKFDYPFQF